MNCTECDYVAPVASFRYLYNARIDASVALRQCPGCEEWLAVDELAGEARQSVSPGQAPWGKSAGVEGLAGDT